MRDSSGRRRRCLAFGPLVLLLTIPALAQTKPFAAGAGQVADAHGGSSLMAVHDGRGTVTIIAEQASVREVFRVLSRWFDFPTLAIDTLPDARVPVRFERMPVSQAVQRLLRLAGLPPAPITPRARAAGVRRSPLVLVHDGHGAVTVMADQASTREVMALLSRWFGFPVVNSEAIPDARGTMRFDRIPVAQLVDRLLRSASLNYVILTNPQTSVPSKVVAAPLSAARSNAPPAQMAPGNEVNSAVPGWPGPANMAYPPVMPGGTMPMPMPMPMPVPVDPAMPMLPIDPSMGGQPYPPALPGGTPNQPSTQSAPGNPGAVRPGVMTPTNPAKPPG